MRENVDQQKELLRFRTRPMVNNNEVKYTRMYPKKQ